MTPMKYAQGRKIVLAKHYLQSTDIPISNLSNILCFADAKYFSNVFKSYMGISPKEFRRRFSDPGVEFAPALHHDDFEKLIPEKNK